MTRFGAALLIVMALTVAAGLLADGTTLPSPSPVRAASPPLLAISTPLTGGSTLLSRFDPDTLAQRQGVLDLGEYHDAWAFSPDRRSLAVGTFSRTGLRLIDPVTLRLQRDVPLPVAAVGVAWVDPRRVAVLLQRGGVVLVDAEQRRILRRWPLTYRPPCQGRLQAVTPYGVVFVVVSPRSGRLRVIRIDRAGRLDVVGLGRVRSPSTNQTCGLPALAVDPARRRILVAGSHGPAAVVDVSSLRVSFRSERGLVGPCDRATRSCAARRTAVWSALGVVALSGVQQVSRTSEQLKQRPLGLVRIDVRTGSARILDRSAGQVAALHDGSLVAFGGRLSGARAMTLGGIPRWRALRGTRIQAAQSANRRVYLFDDAGQATHVLDAASGRSLATAPGGARLEILSGRDAAGDG